MLYMRGPQILHGKRFFVDKNKTVWAESKAVNIFIRPDMNVTVILT